MATLPKTPEEFEPRRVLLLWCAMAIADIQLRLLALKGAGGDPLAHDGGIIHGASDAKPDPYWRTNASFAGTKHEPETLSAAEAREKAIRDRAFGKRICQQHFQINADLVGRCMFCGEPLRDTDPELPPT